MNDKGCLKLSKRLYMALGPDGRVVGKLSLLGPANRLSGALVRATVPDGSLEATFPTLRLGREALIDIAGHHAIGDVIQASWARLTAAPEAKPAPKRKPRKAVSRQAASAQLG